MFDRQLLLSNRENLMDLKNKIQENNNYFTILMA